MNDNGAWTDRRDDLYARVVRQGRARKLRRRVAAAAGVALVAAVVAFGVASATSSPDRSVEVLNRDGSTTTVPDARPAGVLLIGDSVMLGARDALRRDDPGVRVNAAVNRQFGDAARIIDEARRDGTLPAKVVVHLGTNGIPGVEDPFDEVSKEVGDIARAAGPGSSVYFVSLHENRPWVSELNAALYSAAPQWPNVHVLDWSGFALMTWFGSDGYHLAGDGPVQYARFIRAGMRPKPTIFSDPYGDAAVPVGGFYVTSDPKSGGVDEPSSFAVTLFDDDGRERGVLPRATIDSRVMNVERKALVVTDTGIRLAAVPLDRVAGVPDGCTQTEANRVLAVALCGRSGGPDLLLGDRILVNRGSGWEPLIAKPPGAVVGHWNWASPSPDGEWLLASWSAECEVVTGVFIRVADGAVHSVTGEPGIGGPTSGGIGWTALGDALAVFGGDAACGTAAPNERGVYVVSPTEGIRQLLLPLAPDAGVVRWTAVDDRRTRRQAQGSPVRVDLDGDGRVDQLSITPRAIGAIGPLDLRATLADGRVVTGAYPSAYAVEVVGTTDLAGDGRHEVIVTVGGETWTLGAIVVLDGDRLVAIDETPGGAAIGWGAHSNGNPFGTADVACRTVDGRPLLVTAQSTVETDGRHWQRDESALEGGRLIYVKSDTGVVAPGAVPPPGVPLQNGIECGPA